MTKYVGIIKKG